MHESTREPREVTNGSAPLYNALEPLPGLTFAPLAFDPNEFMQFVRDESLTEAQVTELLHIYWEFAVAFVDLRFGLSPAQQVRGNSVRAQVRVALAESGVIESDNTQQDSNQVTRGARNNASPVEEDS